MKKLLTDWHDVMNIELNNKNIKKIQGLDYYGDMWCCFCIFIRPTDVKHLELKNNQISKIQGLNKLYELFHLNLSKNRISRIEGLD